VEAIRDLPSLDPDGITQISAHVHDPGMRHEMAMLLDHWRTSAAGSPADLAAFLAGAAEAVRVRDMAESADLVWSGPAPQRTQLRRTDEALLEVIRAATRVLTLVTFAAYRVPDVREALARSLDRGVEVRFIGETERASDGQLRFDGSLALGQALAKRVRLFEWPLKARPRDARGLTGRLHAKCALADETMLLVSSANLTEAALESNMEIGVLLRGGPLPRLAAQHFEELMRSGTLRPTGDL
jgi:phosphatidylserine/phosphatidylglycerophosphate/cardiolipin synthase-like enzyme